MAELSLYLAWQVGFFSAFSVLSFQEEGEGFLINIYLCKHKDFKVKDQKNALPD